MKTAVLNSAIVMLAFSVCGSGCGGGTSGEETSAVDTPADSLAEDHHTAGDIHTTDEEQSGGNDTQPHSAAFMILEETEAVAEEANARTRELEARIGELR